MLREKIPFKIIRDGCFILTLSLFASCNVSDPEVPAITLQQDFSGKTLVAGETVALTLNNTNHSETDFTLSFYDGFESTLITEETISAQKKIEWKVPMALCNRNCSLIIDLNQEDEIPKDTLSQISINVNNSDEIATAKAFFPISNKNRWIYQARTSSDYGETVVIDTLLIKLKVIENSSLPSTITNLQYTITTLDGEPVDITNRSSQHNLWFIYSIFKPELVFDNFSGSLLDTDAYNYEELEQPVPLYNKFKIFLPLAFPADSRERIDFTKPGYQTVYVIETDSPHSVNFNNKTMQAKTIRALSAFYDTQHTFLNNIGLYSYKFGADGGYGSTISLLAAKVNGSKYGEINLLPDE